MPPKREGWRVLPIVGRREHPERLVEEGVRARKLRGQGSPRGWSEKQALDALWRTASRYPGQDRRPDRVHRRDGQDARGSGARRVRRVLLPAARRDGVPERWTPGGRRHPTSGIRGVFLPAIARNARGVVQDTGPLHRPAGERRRRRADRPFGTGNRKRPPTGDTRGAVSKSGGIDQPPHRGRPA